MNIDLSVYNSIINTDMFAPFQNKQYIKLTSKIIEWI